VSDALTLVVLLHVGDPKEFERFERRASSIMARHGGRIERRIRTAIEDDAPDEVHVVTFTSENDLEAYLQDPELAALAELRQRAIRRTEVWRGNDLPPFD
jgi:uncharacterized protein (DUF1330 family)